jgi:antirestriction protein ArdC
MEWRRYLEFQSRFHRYSYANALLIAAQFPAATQVAGYATWRRLHRVVKRGERAIWILAPIRRRSAADAEGETVEPVRGFRAVAVFDHSQTEGAPAPAAFVRLGGGDPGGAYARLAAVAGSLGFSVEETRLSAGSNGDCSHARRLIRVEERNAPAQQVKTLAHELAHALLHEQFASRALAELEAESAAYVICAALGIDSGDYSFGYLATWAGGGADAVAAIKSSCARIQRAARGVLDALAWQDEIDDLESASAAFVATPVLAEAAIG